MTEGREPRPDQVELSVERLANDRRGPAGGRLEGLGGRRPDRSHLVRIQLGYDFCIEQGTRRIYYEVKATPGWDLEFAHGESEVRVASACASEQGDLYRILFILAVLDSAQRRIRVLANPLSEQGKRHFRLVGSGMRFRFALADRTGSEAFPEAHPQ